MSLLRRYSVSDEQGSRIEGSCLHDMHLAAGDVHLWWLFPEDVGPCTLHFCSVRCPANVCSQPYMYRDFFGCNI